MPAYRCQPLEELARQLAFSPPDRRRTQIDRAEQLYWEIEPERNYPLEFLIYRITGYRAEDALEPATLVGAAVRADLLTLVEQLSETLADPVDRYAPPPLDLEQVRRRLRVTARTISRYRRDGLFARKLTFPNGRVRLAFLPASVERFERSRGETLDEAKRFSRIDEPTRHAILCRARRIAARVEVSPFAVAQHLAGKYGRSVEAIRRLLVQHDQADPRFAIFPDHTPPLSEKAQRVILRAWARGVPVRRLADRFQRSRDAIYRVIHVRRAAALRRRRIRWIASPTFDLPDAEAIILADDPADAARHVDAPDAAAGPTDETAEPDASAAAIEALARRPLPDAAAEARLFARYNYMKYRAARLIAALDRHRPRPLAIDEAETWLRRAARERRRLTDAFAPVVIGVARSHADDAAADAAARLPVLIAQGRQVLRDAVERFDPARGGRFAAYLNWALMRRFAQRSDRPAAPPDDEADDPLTGFLPDDERADLFDLLDRLDPRQRYILTRRLGLADEAGRAAPPLSLEQLASQLEIRPERVRQIEQAARRRLHRPAPPRH